MGDWVEWVKLIGSVAGILSGIFLIYDRLVRIRPQAYLSKGDYDHVNVVVRNSANETIIIDELRISPNVVGLAKGHSPRAMAKAIVQRGEDNAVSVRPCFFVIEPLGELELGLVSFEKFETLTMTDQIVIRMAWRHSRYSWPFKRTIAIRTTVGDVWRLKERDGG